jgi:diguanylate cyclase (GGDEF)-like protein/PAS domain S-box-containing protein
MDADAEPVSGLGKLRPVVVTGAIWLFQLLLIALEFGLPATIGWIDEVGSLALCGFCVWLCLRAEPGEERHLLALGALAGLALGSSNVLALQAVAANSNLSAAGATQLALALVPLLLASAALLSCRAILNDRIGIALAVLLAAGGYFATQMLSLDVLAPQATAPAACVRLALGTALVAGGLLLGARLGDLGFAVSARTARRRERFHVLADALPIPVTLTGADDGRIVFSNRRAVEQFRLSRDAEDPVAAETLYVNPQDQKTLHELVRRYGEIDNQEVEMWHADGTAFWALTAERAIIFDGQEAILSTFYDISDRKEAEAALLASEVRYALISRASNDGIWDWNIAAGTVYYSSRWKEIVGAEPDKPLGSLEDWLSRVHPDDSARLRAEIDAHLKGETRQLDSEYRIRHGDGHYCWMQCRGIALRNKAGEPVQMAGSQSDITLRKTYEINLLNAAYEDRLTGVNNRAFFNHIIETRNDAASIQGKAVALFNVDQFRRVNDNLGTGAGDALLIAIARRLATRVAAEDALCHLGGDEFAVWFQNVPDHDSAQAMVDAMFSDLSEPYALGDVELPVTLSVGVATPTLGDAVCGGDLLRNARLAIERAKQIGGGRVELFDDILLRETQLRRRLARDLTNAERLGQIFFEYQPIVELGADGSHRIAAFESLMRWNHPQLGLISPTQFIPIAEEAGLIGSLGLFAIEMAAARIKDWVGQGIAGPGFSISVNLSARQISDRASVARLHALLDRLNIEHGRIKLEITESVLMSDPEAMVGVLESLRSRGIPLQLDDFGTGYSSLSYLHRFPLDVLKIDRSFVARMLSAPEAFRLVRSIIELGHDLGLKIVAEGVEAQAEVRLLHELGCDFAQGYHFSRPVPAAQAAAQLARGGF